MMPKRMVPAVSPAMTVGTDTVGGITTPPITMNSPTQALWDSRLPVQASQLLGPHGLEHGGRPQNGAQDGQHPAQDGDPRPIGGLGKDGGVAVLDSCRDRDHQPQES